MSVHREGETVKARVLITMLALAAIFAAVSGCETDNPERQAVVCEVELTNAGEPLISAMSNTNGTPDDDSDDFTPIDSALFTFRARPYLSSSMTQVDAPFSWFRVTSYDLVWTPLNGAPAEIANYNLTGGGMDLIVPLDDETEHAIIIVDPAMKNEAWFPGQSGNSTFQAKLTINFKGHATGSEYEVTVPSSLTVTFIPSITD
jgi:hypothetical protein